MIQTFGRTCPQCTRYLVRRYPSVSAFHLAYCWSLVYRGLNKRTAEEVLVGLQAVKKLSDREVPVLKGIALFYSARYEEAAAELKSDTSTLSREYLGRALLTLGDRVGAKEAFTSIPLEQRDMEVSEALKLLG